MATKQIKRKSQTKSQTASSRGLTAKVQAVNASVQKAEMAGVKAGDTVRVHTRIKEGDKTRIQIFEGTVIAVKNRDGGKSVMVRKMSHGVGVERVFLETSPKVAKIEVMQSGKVRRAKLYFLRGLEGRKAKLDREMNVVDASPAGSDSQTQA